MLVLPPCQYVLQSGNRLVLNYIRLLFLLKRLNRERTDKSLRIPGAGLMATYFIQRLNLS